MKRGKRHMLWPDTQVRPGVDVSHITWVAHYAAERDVDTVVMIGDWWDMPSLSQYDKAGSKKAEGRRVRADIDAGRRCMETVAEVWERERFCPRKVFTMGNHENRINRAVADNPTQLEGVIGIKDLGLEDYGWKVSKFLDPVTVDGIRYCHFFPHNANGQVMQNKRGAPSARAQAQRQMCSATAGHQQGLDVACIPNADRNVWGLIAGSCYLHDEDYIGPKAANAYWRGVVIKNDVRRGDYDPMLVSLPWLEQKYRRTTTPRRITA